MNPLLEGLKRHLGEEQLAKLAQVKVGIGGAGGLGSNVANHLVRSGLKSFVIADFDLVEPSNLNRQFFFADQIGQLKVEALAVNLRRINPDIELEIKPQRVTAENVGKIFGACHLWVEAFDQAEVKKLFVEEGLRRGKRVVCASGLAGWGDTDSMTTKKWGKGFVIVGDLETGVGDGIPPMSPRVGVAASKEANVVLRWALGEED